MSMWVSSPDFWQRHLWQLNPEGRQMNAFTRWRVSALYPVRRYIPTRQAPAAPKAPSKKKGKSHD